jgi:putative addiction module component (TIGR02574 family)
MARTIEDLKSEALGLEPENRARLAEALLESLEHLSDEENERLWAGEAERRFGAWQAGETTTVDGDEVFARARARKR